MGSKGRKARNEHLMRLWPAIQAKASYLATRYGHPDAGDVANELALHILERAEQDPTFLTDNKQTYITTYAEWRWRDGLRRAGKRARVLHTDASLDAALGETGVALVDLLPDEAPGVEERVISADVFQRALVTLPSVMREALVAVYGGGMTHAEAAAALGRPQGTVSYQVATARKRLAAALAAH